MNALLLSLVLAAPHPSLQVYFQSNLASATYQRAVFDKVAKAWAPPAQRPAAGKKTVVQATIGRDGKVLSATVSLESGSKAWDAAALSAVKGAGPFAPVPQAFTASSVEVHFHLSWEG